MITRTIQTTTVEYKVYNSETDEVRTHVGYLYGTFANDDAIKKYLKIQLLNAETILKVKVVETEENKYGMTLDEFILNSRKLS